MKEPCSGKQGQVHHADAAPLKGHRIAPPPAAQPPAQKQETDTGGKRGRQANLQRHQVAGGGIFHQKGESEQQHHHPHPHHEVAAQKEFPDLVAQAI